MNWRLWLSKQNNMPKKKPFNYLAYIPILVLAITTIAGFVRFQVLAEGTKEKVEKLDKKVEEIIKQGDEDIKEIEEDNRDLEKKVAINKTQQDNMQAQIQQISEKSDKIVDLLIEIKQRKR